VEKNKNEKNFNTAKNITRLKEKKKKEKASSL